MRILFLLTQDIESPGGLGRYFPLAKGLAHLDHQVTIAALHPNFAALSEREQVIGGVRVLYVGPMHVKKFGNHKTYYSPLQLAGVAAQATWHLAQAAWQIPAEIIHIGKPQPMNSLAGLLGRRLPGRKALFVDCDDAEAAQGHYAAGWQKFGVSFFENLVPRLSDRVTTNTAFTRQRLLRQGVNARRIVYLSNGIDPDRFAACDPAGVETLRTRWGLAGKQVIAFIGSLSHPSHPVDLLIRAFELLHPANPQAVLLLVGGGDQFESLESQVRAAGLSNAVIFTGRVAPDQVPVYYRLADVSVDPVNEDDIARGRQPLKLFESWACGVPFVSGAVGDRPLLAGDPPAAWLARPGDPASLAETIQQVLKDPALAATLRQRGLERVAAYDWAILARQLETIYREAAHLTG